MCRLPRCSQKSFWQLATLLGIFAILATKLPQTQALTGGDVFDLTEEYSWSVDHSFSVDMEEDANSHHHYHQNEEEEGGRQLQSQITCAQLMPVLENGGILPAGVCSCLESSRKVVGSGFYDISCDGFCTFDEADLSVDNYYVVEIQGTTGRVVQSTKIYHVEDGANITQTESFTFVEGNFQSCQVTVDGEACASCNASQAMLSCGDTEYDLDCSNVVDSAGGTSQVDFCLGEHLTLQPTETLSVFNTALYDAPVCFEASAQQLAGPAMGSPSMGGSPSAPLPTSPSAPIPGTPAPAGTLPSLAPAGTLPTLSPVGLSPSAPPPTSPSAGPPSSPSAGPPSSPSAPPPTSPSAGVPTLSPTLEPSTSPTDSPTLQPTKSPTSSPTRAPVDVTVPTQSPTPAPTTVEPTSAPTDSPTTPVPTEPVTTVSPSASPTTGAPTTVPPTESPTTFSPTASPTTQAPTVSPMPSSSTDPPTPSTTVQVPLSPASVVVNVVGLDVEEFAFQTAEYLFENMQPFFDNLEQILVSVIEVIDLNGRRVSSTTSEKEEKEGEERDLNVLRSEVLEIRISIIALIRGDVTPDLYDQLNEVMEVFLTSTGAYQASLRSNPDVANRISVLKVVVDSAPTPKPHGPPSKGKGKGVIPPSKGKGAPPPSKGKGGPPPSKGKGFTGNNWPRNYNPRNYKPKPKPKPRSYDPRNYKPRNYNRPLPNRYPQNKYSRPQPKYGPDQKDSKYNAWSHTKPKYYNPPPQTHRKSPKYASWTNPKYGPNKHQPKSQFGGGSRRYPYKSSQARSSNFYKRRKPSDARPRSSSQWARQRGGGRPGGGRGNGGFWRRIEENEETEGRPENVQQEVQE